MTASQHVNRRALLIGLGAVAATPVWAQLAGPGFAPSFPPARPAGLLRDHVASFESLLVKADLGGATGFVLADAQGHIVESHNATVNLAPASVVKSLTALYALHRLGPTFTFRTQVLATGPIVNGVVQGDLILAGSGDPSLTTDGLGDLAGRMKSAGIHGVSGGFFVFGGALPAADQIDASQDVAAGYNPAVGGLNVNFNRVNFEWKKAGGGYQIGVDARDRRYAPSIQDISVKIAGRDVPVFTYEAAMQAPYERWSVAQSALGNGGSRWLPVRQPDLYAGEIFASLARSHGIALQRPARVTALPESSVVVSEHFSAALQELLRDMLKHSNNLYAEAIGLRASLSGAQPVTGLAVSAGLMGDWARARFGLSSNTFVDHSGLGPDNRISPVDMARLLARVGGESPLISLLKPVTLTDANGKPRAQSRVEIYAKTGTLNFVSGLAGYMTAQNGQLFSFAIFSADLARRSASISENGDAPAGSRAWVKRARALQQDLLNRWADAYM